MHSTSPISLSSAATADKSARSARPALGDATIVVAAVFAGLAFGPHTPRWGCMALLAMAIFFALKWLIWRRTAAAIARQPVAVTLGYLFAWPGMDARGFFDRAARPTLPKRMEWLSASGRLAAGALMVWGLARATAPRWPWLAGWIGGIGIILMLHFGLFDFLSLAWRTLGFDARPIMDRPLRSASLGEFWGRRWNLAFTQSAHELVYRPLARRWGPRWALSATFLASGIVHDVAISLPAGGGFGLPTAYFLIQGGGVLIEHSSLGRRLGLYRGLAGRLFAAAVIVLPAAILFHPPFIHRVILPLLAAMGAL